MELFGDKGVSGNLLIVGRGVVYLLGRDRQMRAATKQQVWADVYGIFLVIDPCKLAVK